ncbi:MAG: putative toxin-antitoxin system toxin component, PIN family, partial [Chloroflexi bacterium]|nr:putative toxin-antitoxin system toxin component, PIN family [Chloroflexota bacterium]
MRAVLDVNVIVSALLSWNGAPARILRAWVDGAFDLVMSERLLGELERALAYPRIRDRVDADDATSVLDWLRRSAILSTDASDLPMVRSRDPGDDYLIGLAASAQAILVTRDHAQLELAGRIPVL